MIPPKSQQNAADEVRHSRCSRASHHQNDPPKVRRIAARPQIPQWKGTYMKHVRSRGLVCGGFVVAAMACLSAAGTEPQPIQERARGAARVVVATVAETSARYERNEFGDELIVTHARLAIEEVVKGPDGPAILALEGGTVDGITMRVSSLPSLTTGERAVFFLTPGPHGEFRPHLRGQGILKLDSANRVRGSSLTLNEIRRLAGSTK
jgi:hypothetical protein